MSEDPPVSSMGVDRHGKPDTKRRTIELNTTKTFVMTDSNEVEVVVYPGYIWMYLRDSVGPSGNTVRLSITSGSARALASSLVWAADRHDEQDILIKQLEEEGTA